MRFVSRAQREGVDQMEVSKWRRRSCRIGVLSAAVLAFGLAVVACGGPSTPGVATGSTTTTRSGGNSTGGGSPARGALAYASCMRSHGVHGFPDPNANGDFTELKNETLQQLGVTSTQLRAADHRCVHLLPPGQGGNPLSVQQQQDYLTGAACMRAHGITNFPDPVFANGGVNFPIPSSIDTHSTRFNQARLICERHIPAGLPYSGSAG